jgi:hypothetical protein
MQRGAAIGLLKGMTNSNEPKISILSIDAWANGSGWDWNNWFRVGEIDKATLDTLDTDEKLLAWMVAEGYLNAGLVIGKTVEIDDDQYNVVFCDPSVIDAPEDCDEDDCTEHTHCAMPVFAIAYGEAQ